MNRLHEDKLAPIVIDLDVNKNQINESFLAQFGTAIELILKRMFGLNGLNFNVRGTRSNIRDFTDAVAKESIHMKALLRHGLDNPSAFRTKTDLERAIRKFETSTGIKWPLR